MDTPFYETVVLKDKLQRRLWAGMYHKVQRGWGVWMKGAPGQH